MADITYLSPQQNQCILTNHMEALSRAARGTGVVNGNRLSPTSPATMTINIDAGRIRVAGAPLDVSADTVTLDAAHATLHRVDIIYRDATGDACVVKGTPDAIEDPKGLSDWKSYTSPQPSCDIPVGAILGAIYVPAATTNISSGNIWMFAGGVGDISTSVASPGSDSYPPSEQAVRELAETKINTSDIVTSVGSPGSNSKVPSEQAVRTLAGTLAPAAKGVTNGDNHDHVGGDGAQINHGNLSGLTNDDHSQYYNTARGDARYALLSHATRHKSGGDDSIKLDELAAPTDNTNLNVSTSKHGLMPKLPGTKQAYMGDGTWITRTYDLEFQIDGGSSVITAGDKPGLRIPIAGTITAARIMAARGQSNGSISIDVYKGTYANSPDSMTNIGTFAVSSAKKSESTSLNIAVSEGDWIAPNVASVSTFTAVTLSLTVTIL